MKLKAPEGDQSCYSVNFTGRTTTEISGEFIEFWKWFADVIVPANAQLPSRWTYLHVVLKGPDGTIEVWPRDERAERLQFTYWAGIYTVPFQDFYLKLPQNKFGSPRDKAEKMRWMRMLVDGAEAVHFADLAGLTATGIPVRFFVYEGELPIWETVIGRP